MASLPVPDPPDDATCWICLDEDTDDNPLRRSCACRGSAGYAHLECMIQYATRHFEAMVQKVKKDANQLLKPYATFDVWTQCATCKQSFQGLLAIDMLEHLLLLVEDCFPKNHYFCSEAHSSLACHYRRQCDPSRPNSEEDEDFLQKSTFHLTHITQVLKSAERVVGVPGFPNNNLLVHPCLEGAKVNYLVSALGDLAELEEIGKKNRASALKLREKACKYLAGFDWNDYPQFIRTGMAERLIDEKAEVTRLKHEIANCGLPGTQYIRHLEKNISDMEAKGETKSNRYLCRKSRLSNTLMQHGLVDQAETIAADTLNTCKLLLGAESSITKDLGEVVNGANSMRKRRECLAAQADANAAELIAELDLYDEKIRSRLGNGRTTRRNGNKNGKRNKGRRR